MQTIEITSFSGTYPFDINICDVTNTFCYSVATGVGSVPITVNIPPALDGASEVLIVLTDANNCQEFNLVVCPSPTPTTTPTPTVTPTTPDNTCNCIAFYNVSNTDLYGYYNNCNGEPTSSLIDSGTTVYICGSNPSVSGATGLTFSILSVCVDGSCPPISPTPTTTPTNTPTNTVTPTVTPTITVTPSPSSYCFCFSLSNSSSATITGFTYVDCNGATIFPTIGGNATIKVCGSSASSSGPITVTNEGACVSFVCPSPTPTTTPTPTITPTITVTPTNTTTVTPTPTVTPSPSPPPTTAYLFIEPISGATNIGQWMYDLGQNFFGFTNGSQPTQVQNTFNEELNNYVDYTGWTNGHFPAIIQQNVPQSSGGFDSFGNAIVQYNFVTTEVSAGTVNRGWFTWIIPVNATNYLKQVQIDVGINNSNLFTTLNMESTIYDYTFTYTGSTIPLGTYRVYTTYPGTNFRLANNVSDLYFRGNTVS